MRSLQILIGVALIAAALAFATGAFGAWALIPSPGRGATAGAVAIGLALLVDGVLGLAHGRMSPARRHAVRAAGRAAWTAAIVIGVVLGAPALQRPLDLLVVAGFPAGYWLLAQGAALLLVILAFRAADRMAVIDACQDDDRS